MKKDEIKLKKLFIRFLKENNCYKQFIKNFEDFAIKYRDINKYCFDNIIHLCYRDKLNILRASFSCEKHDKIFNINWYELAESWIKIINTKSPYN